MDKLQKKDEEKICRSSEECLLDCVETLIDEVSKNPIIRSLPLAGIVMAIIDICEVTYNKNLQHQTIKFIEELKNNKVSDDKREKYIRKLKNEGKMEKEIKIVLLWLNKNVEETKSKLLAKFYVAVINEEISWDKFCEFATVIDKIFVEDLSTLYDIYKDVQNEETSITMYEPYKISRIISTGLLSNYSKGMTVGELAGNRPREIFEKNGFGELFVKIATRNDNNA